MAKLMKTLPPGCHPHILVHYLKQEYNLPDIFYLDMWPFGDQICAITDPNVMYQVTIQHSLPKHPAIEEAICQSRARKAWSPLTGRSTENGGRDAPMHAQTSEDDFVSAFRNQLTWLPKANESNPFKIFNPVRPIVYKYNERRMNNFLMKIMNNRFAARSSSDIREKKRPRPIIDLALDVYLEDEPAAKADVAQIFKKAAINHIKVFMFAGRDTASSTICYAACALSEIPEAMKRVQQEYDEVFGPDISETAQKIKDDPYHQSATLHGFMTWVVAHALHRSSRLRPEPYKFLPERWLVKEGDPLFPVKGAWRPFEFGPRNCIGQELAMIETKIIMALMVRQFDITLAYDEIDRANGISGIKTTPEGERAYQVRIATAKPVNGMP
ncbi:MAG: hypothetical protein Q9217_005390, partial [Psora testacea]